MVRPFLIDSSCWPMVDRVELSHNIKNGKTISGGADVEYQTAKKISACDSRCGT